MTIDPLLQRLAAGDDSALDELLSYTCDRMRRLTRKMLRDFPGVHRWEQTDDVFNNALLRLCRSLCELRPTTEASFFRLAALNIRRELIDLARHYKSDGANLTSNAGDSPAREPIDPWDPERLARWRDFHEQVERLPDESREVIDLLIYHSHTQAEAATRLGISVRMVQYRYAAALKLLHQALGGEMPE